MNTTYSLHEVGSLDAKWLNALAKVPGLKPPMPIDGDAHERAAAALLSGAEGAGAGDWAPNHDERNRDYPIRPALRPSIAHAASVWPLGPVLNQGKDGACVGYAFAAATGQADQAERVYSIAKTLDAVPGEAYHGTSVLAGARAAKALNLIESYRWAFGIEDVVDTLRTTGPVVLGLYWRESMRRVSPGEPLRVAGADIGGHCTVAFAYDPACAVLDGQPGVCIRNSWGTGWGTNGEAWITTANLAALLDRNGEACVITP